MTLDLDTHLGRKRADTISPGDTIYRDGRAFYVAAAYYSDDGPVTFMGLDADDYFVAASDAILEVS